MTRRILPNGAQDRWLASLLKSAAEAERPAFSPELHNRILRQVLSAQADHVRRLEPTPSRRNLQLWAVAILAVCSSTLLAVWLGGGFGQRDSRVPPGANGKMASQPQSFGGPLRGFPGTSAPTPALGRQSLQKLITAPDVTAEQVKTALQELEERRWASLDQDLLVAGELLKKQIPLGLVAQLRDGQAEKLP